MTEESDVFLEGAGLLGSPFSVGRDPPCLLKFTRNNKGKRRKIVEPLQM